MQLEVTRLRPFMHSRVCKQKKSPGSRSVANPVADLGSKKHVPALPPVEVRVVYNAGVNRVEDVVDGNDVAPRPS